MGAESFILEGIGSSPAEVFNSLVEEAVYYHGNDSYNGTISTCSMGRCQKTFYTYDKTNEMEARDFIHRNENGDKWIAHYIDLGVVETVEITAKKTTKKYDAVYRQKFGVFSLETGRLINTRATFKTKGEADNYAVSCVLDGKSVIVRKCPILEKGNDTVSTFELVEKKVKKAGAKKNPNSRVVQKHKYIFYGWASC